MDATLAQFNATVNSSLSFLDDPIVGGFLKLFLVLYGGLAAPSLPPKVAALFTNTYFRIVILGLVLWIANRDPALSVMIATVFFVSLSYATKNAVTQVVTTGKVTPEVAVIISGGSGPSIKPAGVVQQEARIISESVREGALNLDGTGSALAPVPATVPETTAQAARVPASVSEETVYQLPQPAPSLSDVEYAVAPEAVMSQTGEYKKPQSQLPQVPAMVTLDEQTMTAPQEPTDGAEMGVPSPYMSDQQALFAELPQGA